MKACVAVSALLMGTVWASSQAADAVSPDIFQTTVAIPIPAGSQDGLSAAITVPVNKRLVIQTVTVYANSGDPGSTTRTFLQTNMFNITSQWALPDLYIDTVLHPSATLSATFYAGAGSAMYFSAYRNGDTTDQELLFASISGYYVAKP